MGITAALLLLVCMPQGDESPFVVKRNPATGHVTVSADSKAINCLDALYQLGAALGWNVDVESKPLAGQLAQESIDLYLDDQQPRMIGQLIAVSGGGGVVFDDGPASSGGRPTLHVVRRPDPETEAGRQRLRGISEQWYRSFLVDELRYDPLVEGEAMQVRMHLGHLLIDNGQLESAIPFFREIYEQRPHDFVPMALLRMAECYLDLEQYEDAEKWAREILEHHPSQPQVTHAAVLLGRALLGQDRFDECRRELTARAMRLLDSPQMVDLYLLVGEAERRLAWPTRVFETVQTLRQAREFDNLTESQFLDYHFLLGYGALGSKRPDLAIKALEWFLIRAEDDRRRGVAYVMLGKAYLAEHLYLQARAAATEVREHHMAGLGERDRREALKLYARAALAIGEREAAFLDLEKLVYKEEDPALTLFLADELIADKQWQWAITVTRRLTSRDDHFGDEARFRTVLALHRQATAADNLQGFATPAIEAALRIHDPDLRRQCAELIGDAYTRMGKFEHAADAYRGILR